jgi:Methyltransferase domain
VTTTAIDCASPSASATRQSSVPVPIPCRLCASQSAPAFTLRVLARHDVDYFECEGCGSIQTESPHWLAEAYGDDVHPEDSGYLTRNLLVQWHVAHLLKGLSLPERPLILDWGGGLGIVPRLLRENGHDAYNFDTYTKSPFGDVDWQGASPDFILAAELFEHLPDPATDIAAMFAHQPDYLYVRTWRYFGQGPTWSYIGASHGEHVFFYTDKAMQWIADRYGYHLTLPSEVDALFSKAPLTSFQRKVVIPGLYSRKSRALQKLLGKFRRR